MAEKKKFELEFLVHISTKMLYQRLTSPTGLAEWFADDVNINNGVYSFVWDGAVEKAKLVSSKQDEVARYQWLQDEGTDYYFEFRIKTDSLTNEVALIVTDFAEDDEKDDAVDLWESQVQNLAHIMGG